MPLWVQAESETGEDSSGGEYYEVELQRGTRGFGFSIRGGREFHNMPLFVLRIAENGPAAEDGKLKVASGICILSILHHEMLKKSQIFRSSMLISSYYT